ncbi:MAG: 23S rRNA (pseudouridine(1915)-N(3))-methyltransferase RlmH [Erysipelotrichaceae bacterium]|nr:23S rRNA (pseudouridine(1915)-N(3))-methyltransferase RlmH [Erysipelotrichaceae bacterium]
MKINLLVIGKIKDLYLKQGIEEYLKRLSNYCEVLVKEFDDESIVDKPSKKEIEIATDKECERVLKTIKNTDYVITLDLGKKQLDSKGFAEFLSQKFNTYGSHLTFVIGGSYGLSNNLKKRANDSISLSAMTFTHQMTRLIFLEQVYRAFKILNNEVYHK